MSLATHDASRTHGRGSIRHDRTRGEVRALFDLPFPELMFRAQTIHRQHFDPTEVQISTLLSIKTGGCPEDCAYCPQSARYHTGVQAEKLMSLEVVLAEARAAFPAELPPAEAHPDPGEPRPVHRRRAADQNQRDVRPSQDAETDLHLGLAEIDEPPVRGEQRQEGQRPARARHLEPFHDPKAYWAGHRSTDRPAAPR